VARNLKKVQQVLFEGLLNEIFYIFKNLVWISPGLNRNRFWFFNFKDAPLISENHFSFDPVYTNLLGDPLNL
jgi:hypothetical protein